MIKQSEEEAQKIIDKFFSRASRLKQWLDEVRQAALKNKHTRSLCGRARWYDVPERGDDNYRKTIAQIERFAGNQPIQASSADMTKRALAKFYLDIRGGKWTNDVIYPGAKLLLTVHDEIVGECKEEHAGTTKALGPVPLILKSAMEWSYSTMGVDRWQILDDGHKKKVRAYLTEIENTVDVGVSDYWEK